MIEPRKKNKQQIIYFWLMTSSFIIGVGLLSVVVNDPQILNIIKVVLGSLIGLIILRFPVIGLGLVIDSTILADLLPKTAVFTSVTPIIGIITVVAFLLQEKFTTSRKKIITKTEFIGVLFVFWIIISNPYASFLGETRSWVFTFVQLWLLLWMARRFLRSEQDHRIFLLVVLIGVVVSAVAAFSQTGYLIDFANRAEGFSGGANTAVRYFAYGLVILFYFQNIGHHHSVIRFLLFAGVILLTFAIFLTGSRSGIILLIIIALMQLIHSFKKNKTQSLMIVFVMFIGFGWFANQAIFQDLFIPKAIIRSIVEGTDTVGYRYALWRAGFEMFLDYPITGVGIGKFSNNLSSYWNSPSVIRASSAHNTYIEIVAETGIVGVVLFFALIISAVSNYLNGMKLKRKQLVEINWTYLVIFIILLIGSFTKADLVDKFFWLLMGINISNIDLERENYNQLASRKPR